MPQILQGKLNDDNINMQPEGSIAIKSLHEKKSTVKSQRCNVLNFRLTYIIFC